MLLPFQRLLKQRQQPGRGDHVHLQPPWHHYCWVYTSPQHNCKGHAGIQPKGSNGNVEKERKRSELSTVKVAQKITSLHGNACRRQNDRGGDGAVAVSVLLLTSVFNACAIAALLFSLLVPSEYASLGSKNDFPSKFSNSIYLLSA